MLLLLCCFWRPKKAYSEYYSYTFGATMPHAIFIMEALLFTELMRQKLVREILAAVFAHLQILK